MATVPIQMTAGDYVRAGRLAQRGRGWSIAGLAVALLVALAFTVILLAFQLTDERAPRGVLEIAVASWVIALTLIDRLSGFGDWRRFRKRPTAREPTINIWSPHGLERRVSEEVEHTAWSDVRRWREDRHSIVIVTGDGGGLVIPKRQVPPADLDELRSYLDAPRPAGPTTPRRAEPGAAPLTDARNVTLTEDEFVAAYGAANRWTPAFAIGLVALIAALVTAFAIIGLARGRPVPLGLWLSALGLWTFVGFVLWTGPRGSRRDGVRLYKRLREEGAPLDFTWGAEGVDVRPPGGWRRLPWTEFRGWRETPDHVLLITSVKGWMAIPRRTLDPADLDRLRGYLSAAGSRRRG